jgi:hypothetical protein
MKVLKKIGIAGAAASAALFAGVSWGSGVAHAANGPAQYTAKSATSAVSGYFAHEFGAYFTHITSYIGSDGNSISQLKPGPANGAGVGLCNQTTGEAAQAGQVLNTGGLTTNVDYGVGNLGAPVSNNNPCQNGTVGITGTLISNVPVGHTVRVDILFDQKHAHNGCHAGQAVFLAEDLSAGTGVTKSSPCVSLPSGTVFNEGDAGVTADDTNVAPLPLQSIPQSDSEDNMLVRFAHVNLNGNSPTGEIKGTIQNNSAWTTFPVGSTSNGLTPPGGSLLLAPGVFSSDHFLVKVGGATG